VIRVAFILFLIASVAVATLAMVGEPGSAVLEWLGWRIEMTAATASLLVLFSALAAAIFWRLVLWIADAPQRAAQARADQRRRQGGEALSRGYLAAAAGDGSEARRMAQRASDLVEENPALVRILAAQAAEAAGDLVAAKAAYTAMLGFPDMRLAGLRGLMQNALIQNDRATALRYAQEAYSLAKTARWAWRALLEDRLAAGDWSEALDLVKTALDRKIVSPIVADRARAALLAASAASIEDRRPQQALDFASQSAKLDASFVPGVVIAARLLVADCKAPRAASLIENAWKAAPHPALWLTYRDMITAENPKARAQRLAALTALNPGPREARVLAVEQALVANDHKAAALAAEALTGEPDTARLCGLRARLAYGLGDADGARVWMARGARAPQEPAWSDIDPSGKAFPYSPADWARLVSAYAETGELIHPRYERRDPVISELPPMPIAYDQPYLDAAQTGLTPPPDGDPGLWGGAFDEQPDPEPVAAVRRRPAVRRRLTRAGK